MVPVCGVPRKGPDTTLQVSPEPGPRAPGPCRTVTSRKYGSRLELLGDGGLIVEGNEVVVKGLLVAVRDDGYFECAVFAAVLGEAAHG